MRKLIALSILFGAGSLLQATSICEADVCGFLDDAGSFSIIEVPGASSTIAYGINNGGQIVGTYTNSSGYHSFLDNAGTINTIDPPGSRRSLAYGINNAGTVVGDFGDDNGPHGFLYNAGSFTNVDIGFYDTLYGINDLGQMVGTNQDPGSGFLIPPGVFPFIDVPGQGLTLTYARGINNAGQVVGSFSSYSGGGDTAGSFVYDSIADSFTFLDLPGFAHPSDINNVGQIVGDFYDGHHNHGVLYNYTTGSLTPIDMPGASDTSVRGINDAGQMVGSFSAIPEPGSMWLLGSGLVGISFGDDHSFLDNAGTVVGDFSDDNGPHGFLYNAGSFTNIDLTFSEDFVGIKRCRPDHR